MTQNEPVINPNSAEKAANKVAVVSSTIPITSGSAKQIRRISLPENNAAILQAAKDFSLRVEAASPVANSLLDIVNGANCKFAKIVAKKRSGCDEKKAQELSEFVRISSDSISAASKAGARMLARRIQNDELLDVLVLCGTGGELMAGWIAFTNEMKEIERLKNNGQ